MNPFFPYTPDFEAMHAKGYADLWWIFILSLSSVTSAIPVVATHLTFGYWGFTALVAIASFCWLGLSLVQLGKLERKTLALMDQGLDVRVWVASREQQIKLQFEPIGEYYGFELLSRKIGDDSENYDGHEVIIRNGSDTVAFADVIKIHDEAYWTNTWYDHLEIAGTPLQLWSIFETPEVRSRLSRARSLGVAMLSYAGIDARRSNNHALELGQAKTYVSDAESTEARNQRSAVIMAIRRRQDIPELLDLEHITEALVQNYRSERFNLSDYEYSGDIANQLSRRDIDFAGYL